MSANLNDVSVSTTRQILEQLAGKSAGGGGGQYEGVGVGEVSENVPALPPPNVVRSCESNNEMRPPEGFAGAMKAQLTKLADVSGVKSSEGVVDAVVEPGLAKSLKAQLYEQKDRAGRVEKEAIMIDKQAQPIVCENQPYHRQGVIRESDTPDSEKGFALSQGYARQIASALESGRDGRKLEQRGFVNVKEDTTGPSVVENNPMTRTDVVHCNEPINDMPAIDPGYAKGLVSHFVQKGTSAQQSKITTDTRKMSSAREAGVFENKPTVRENVIREMDKFEQTNIIPDNVTSAMRQVWQERGVLVDVLKPATQVNHSKSNNVTPTCNHPITVDDTSRISDEKSDDVENLEETSEHNTCDETENIETKETIPSKEENETNQEEENDTNQAKENETNQEEENETNQEEESEANQETENETNQEKENGYQAEVEHSNEEIEKKTNENDGGKDNCESNELPCGLPHDNSSIETSATVDNVSNIEPSVSNENDIVSESEHKDMPISNDSEDAVDNTMNKCDENTSRKIEESVSAECDSFRNEEANDEDANKAVEDNNIDCSSGNEHDDKSETVAEDRQIESSGGDEVNCARNEEMSKNDDETCNDNSESEPMSINKESGDTTVAEGCDDDKVNYTDISHVLG